MRLLLTISLALWLGAAQAESVRMLVQSSPLAGSQYYAVGEQWQQMKVGDHLDLICRDGRTLVFVEVRLRGRGDFGGAGASITAVKRRRIVLAARHYLAGKAECDCRFDCVLIDGDRLQWIRDAFAADD